MNRAQQRSHRLNLSDCVFGSFGLASDDRRSVLVIGMQAPVVEQEIGRQIVFRQTTAEGNTNQAGVIDVRVERIAKLERPA